MFSYSRVECFKNCPYQYKLRYVDKVEVLPNQDPSNALYLGTALHTGIEKDVESALTQFNSNFYVINDLTIDETIKLEYLIPLAKKELPTGGSFEVKVECGDFVGYIDYLLPIGKDEYAIYDFKYSNNVDRYLAKSQLDVYKYYFEKFNPGKTVTKLYFMFVPKTMIRQKKTETLEQFRIRLRETLSTLQIQIEEVTFNDEKIHSFLKDVSAMQSAKNFDKNETKLCDWCDYVDYCKKGLDYMLLPKNERRNVESIDSCRLWIYGQPFSGKTYFTDRFPNVLMLNTDGNIRNVTAPFITIKDKMSSTGRTVESNAWTLFKHVVSELKKNDNTFETIVVDLVEDLYESCRLAKYDEMKISHESDAPFKAWDVIRTEFLSVMRELVNLDYKYIVLISHEDSSKDLTKKYGDKITAIKPNITDKVANKLAGMVDMVCRVVADDDTRKLSFANDEVIFGGGRMSFEEKEIPLDYDDFVECFENAKKSNVSKNIVTKVEEKEEKPVEEKTEEAEKEEKPLARKNREVEEKPVEEEKSVEEKPRRRSRRKVE